MAVRAALGAGRLRLVRQLLTESVLLAMLSGALGILLGIWGMAILRSLFPIDAIASPDSLRLDARVLGFTLLVCLLTPLLFGLAPALYGTKLDLNESLKEGGRGFRAGGSHRFREYLVVSEVGLAVALLGLGGLVVRLALVVGNRPSLFDSKNLLTMAVSLPESAYPHAPDVAEFYRRVLEAAQAIPGVESVGLVDRPPIALLLEDRRALSPIDIENGPGTEARVSAIPLKVSPGYFSALRITPRRGRVFSGQDAAGAARVALINETLARSWRGEDPLGKRLRLASPGPEQPWITVVGVVGDFTTDEHKRLLPAVYLPCAQNAERAMTFVVRTFTPPRGLEEPLKRALWSVDKDQPVEGMGTLAQIASDQLAEPYAMVKLIVAFAALALILAAVGVYSVMSYVVAQRTHEIGLRMSLGARPSDVVQMLAKEAMQLIASGLVLGLVATFAFGRLLGHELGEIRPYDPITLSCASVVLMASALLACYLPARRAMKVDPMVALRYE